MSSLINGILDLVKYTNIEVYRWTIDKCLEIIDKVIDMIVAFAKS